MNKNKILADTLVGMPLSKIVALVSSGVLIVLVIIFGLRYYSVQNEIAQQDAASVFQTQAVVNAIDRFEEENGNLNAQSSLTEADIVAYGGEDFPQWSADPGADAVDKYSTTVFVTSQGYVVTTVGYGVGKGTRSNSEVKITSENKNFSFDQENSPAGNKTSAESTYAELQNMQIGGQDKTLVFGF